MSKLPTIKILFYLAGDDFSEQDISNELGVVADDFRAKDDWPDVIKNNKNLQEQIKIETVWCVSIKEEHSYAVSKQFEKMINMFKDKKDIISKLREKLGLVANFEIVINMEIGDEPEMVLTKEIINFASSLDAEIGFDMYVFCEHESLDCT